MSQTPFIEQVPEQFRKDPILNKFIENIYFRVNETIRQSVATQLQVQAVSDDVQLALSQIQENPEEFNEVLLNSTSGNFDAISNTYYYTPGGTTAILYFLRLPRFPEENFYIRAQVFGENTIAVIQPSESSINPIGDGGPIFVSGDGNLIDIRYSISQNRYVVT